MLRRLLLTCAVVLCSTLAETTLFIVFISIVTLVIETETKPYISRFLSAFTRVCCWQVSQTIRFGTWLGTWLGSRYI